MALGSNHVTTTTAANFIPELWSDEIVATYEKSLVAANLFKSMPMTGKKGDTIHIPTPSRGSASLKASNATVTLQATTDSDILVVVDKHYEYSKVIEDIVEAQALSSMRQFYTDDAGYALSRQVDTSILELGRTFNGGSAGARYNGAFIGGDGTTAFNFAANTNAGNATALTDAAIRRTIQRLDDNDIPEEGRFILVPPSTRNTLMGINRFTEQAFIGDGNAIRTGQIGNIYGIPVYVSSNCDFLNSAVDGSGTNLGRVVLIGHRDAAVLVEQQKVRSQAQYKQEYLGTLYTADTIYGVKELRDNACFALAVPL